ncbi:hypothetical protein EMIHUDRAFT_216028 [Emiliania huxleyi CCMP1516]|uniref:Uncharacterized protein n=2 Tax=Emiliania huxleyi TaxID=2903 RepID=A0A0D3IGB5_EMIH1|nr:hypothetical protein EMIHUDRAFT_216028 [Emiliania huxleyi CCMP1516]EOD10300.1 hypothetical protein EMIHUDRAFT_216028 [Emiliania huxleyi CCMP1516]|eukprot:XP_005762729.1 hypothetical protein EMIHUDRAFT_216028 [Emiliania huxleyi CCMP1516]
MDSPAIRMVSRVHLQIAVRKAPAARCSNSLVIWEDPRLERLAFRFPSIAALLDECSLAAYATALEDEGYSVRGLGELAFASPNELRHALVDGVGLAPREWEQLLRTLLDAGESRQRAEAAAQGGASGGGPALSAQQTPLCSARLRLVLREAEPFEVAGREALEEECAEEEGGLGGAGEGGGSAPAPVLARHSRMLAALTGGSQRWREAAGAAEGRWECSLAAHEPAGKQERSCGAVGWMRASHGAAKRAAAAQLLSPERVVPVARLCHYLECPPLLEAAVRTLASAVDAANAPSVLLLAHELGEPALERAAVGGILADLDEVEKAEYWLELPPLTRATAAHASRRSSTPPTPMPWSGRRATLRTLRDATARNPLLSAGPHAARGSSASSPRELLAMVREALAEMRERLADAQLRQEQESDSGDARQRKTAAFVVALEAYLRQEESAFAALAAPATPALTQAWRAGVAPPPPAVPPASPRGAFVPTYEWQTLPEAEACLPAGLEVELPLDGRPRRARIPPRWTVRVWLSDELGFWREAAARDTPCGSLRLSAAAYAGVAPSHVRLCYVNEEMEEMEVDDRWTVEEAQLFRRVSQLRVAIGAGAEEQEGAPSSALAVHPKSSPVSLGWRKYLNGPEGRGKLRSASEGVAREAMVRLKGYLYLHLERERGRFKRVVLRVRVWDWFRLGATDVIEAPHEDMIKSYTSFTEAAAAVHKALYRNADTAPENVCWNDYVAYIRSSLPQSSDSNRAHNPAGDGPFNRSRRRGTLPCRFYIVGITSYTHASPELASVKIDSLRFSDGSGEWVRAGHLRPFVPDGVELAEIDPLVRRQIRFDQHHMRRSNSLNAVRKRSRHDREQQEEEEGQGRRTGTTSGGAPQPRKKVKSLDAGDLVFVDWLRVPNPEQVHSPPFLPADLPAFIVSSEIVRMDMPTAARGENSPLDVRLAPWSRDGLTVDPATHFVVPRNHLINFNAGFRDAWAHSARAEERAGAVHASLLDAIEYIVEFRRRRRPGYPGVDHTWRNLMGAEPLPARFCAGGERSG